MTENTTTTAAAASEATAGEEGRALPCFVRHEDAGGQCREPATVRVHGIGFCAKHGEEARLGARLEAEQDAIWYFERLEAEHVPRLQGAIRRGLSLVTHHHYSNFPESLDYDRALLGAYAADAPEEVRSRTLAWQEDEGPGYPPVFDTLMDNLQLLHKLIRLAFEDKKYWLVEVLEEERERVAAQAACALEEDTERARGVRSSTAAPQ